MAFGLYSFIVAKSFGGKQRYTIAALPSDLAVQAAMAMNEHWEAYYNSEGTPHHDRWMAVTEPIAAPEGRASLVPSRSAAVSSQSIADLFDTSCPSAFGPFLGGVAVGLLAMYLAKEV